MVSPAPETKILTEKDSKKKEEQSSEDAAFQALLNSQRDILSKLDFGNSTSSELQFVEGPDNLPLVSPNNSADFDSSYSNYEHDYSYEEYCHHREEYRRQQQQQQRPRDEFPPTSAHSMGVGDDRFILDEIEIGPGEVKGPEVFEVDHQARRRKRETERELVETVSKRNKKRRNGSLTFQLADETFSDDLLPGISDLEDLDESAASLLLDELDFPAVHSTREAAMWKPRDRTVTEDSEMMEEQQKATKMTPGAPKEEPTKLAEEEMSIDVTGAVAQQEDLAARAPVVNVPNRTRPPLPRREQRSLWKPRRRTSSQDSYSNMSIEDMRSMWKPRKRTSTASCNDSSVSSLQMEDLDLPKRSVARTVSAQSTRPQQQTLQASFTGMDDGDCSGRRCPSRTTSGDSTGSSSVKTLSEALQQTIGSTKMIQDWDKKMGLKRSHSKTMRLSSKSREQLLAFLQKEQEGDSQAMEEGDDVPKVVVADPKGASEVAVVEL